MLLRAGRPVVEQGRFWPARCDSGPVSAGPQLGKRRSVGRVCFAGWGLGPVTTSSPEGRSSPDAHGRPGCPGRSLSSNGTRPVPRRHSRRVSQVFAACSNAAVTHRAGSDGGPDLRSPPTRRPAGSRTPAISVALSGGKDPLTWLTVVTRRSCLRHRDAEKLTAAVTSAAACARSRAAGGACSRCRHGCGCRSAGTGRAAGPGRRGRVRRRGRARPGRGARRRGR
jgi:hypothetical protein